VSTTLVRRHRGIDFRQVVPICRFFDKPSIST
jgi:hypothetical protein